MCGVLGRFANGNYMLIQHYCVGSFLDVYLNYFTISCYHIKQISHLLTTIIILSINSLPPYIYKVYTLFR